MKRMSGKWKFEDIRNKKRLEIDTQLIICDKRIEHEELRGREKEATTRYSTVEGEGWDGGIGEEMRGKMLI
jgi:hypothetical protein